MGDEAVTETMKVRPVYNLEFPSWCSEINIFGYRFSRVSDYENKILSLQHIGSGVSEFNIQANTGKHAHTANVELPEKEPKAILEWSGTNNSALMDMLLFLSIFTGRDVFALESLNSTSQDNGMVIYRDPRQYLWGGTLRCSIPYKRQPIELEPRGYNVGFEEGINQIYKLIRSEEWQKKYKGGYFLRLANMAFHHQTLESTFVQCWTIWEHLFSILNRQWLSDDQIHRINAKEKISFVLVNYALAGEIDNISKKRIETLAEIRNRLVHFGRFPEHDKVKNDAVLFIRMTEFVIAKTLGLSPSNVFTTIERLEEFLARNQKTDK